MGIKHAPAGQWCSRGSYVRSCQDHRPWPFDANRGRARQNVRQGQGGRSWPLGGARRSAGMQWTPNRWLHHRRGCDRRASGTWWPWRRLSRAWPGCWWGWPLSTGRSTRSAGGASRGRRDHPGPQRGLCDLYRKDRGRGRECSRPDRPAAAAVGVCGGAEHYARKFFLLQLRLARGHCGFEPADCPSSAGSCSRQGRPRRPRAAALRSARASGGAWCASSSPSSPSSWWEFVASRRSPSSGAGTARRGRRQVLARVAGQYGTQYSEDDPYDLPGHDFGLLRAGNRRGCQNVLSGRWQDLPVKEAELLVRHGELLQR